MTPLFLVYCLFVPVTLLTLFTVIVIRVPLLLLFPVPLLLYCDLFPSDSVLTFMFRRVAPLLLFVADYPVTVIPLTLLLPRLLLVVGAVIDVAPYVATLPHGVCCSPRARSRDLFIVVVDSLPATLRCCCWDFVVPLVLLYSVRYLITFVMYLLIVPVLTIVTLFARCCYSCYYQTLPLVVWLFVPFAFRVCAYCSLSAYCITLFRFGTTTTGLAFDCRCCCGVLRSVRMEEGYSRR